MLIGLCFVAFIAGIAVGSHYKEQFMYEEQRRKANKLRDELITEGRKKEYTDYIWRCQD